MLLLAQRKSMTVTQMSSYIGVTKASLYHSIADLVKDGFVSEPEVRVKKNYIEKYYHLSTLAFRAVDPFELQKRLNQGVNSAECKDLLEAFFTSFSLYFQIFAYRIRNTPMEKLQQFAKELKEEHLLLCAWNLDDDVYQQELKEIHTLLKRPMAKEKAKSDSAIQRSEHLGEETNKIFIITMPRSLMRFSS
jgi:predicted transcriptional regulator